VKKYGRWIIIGVALMVLAALVAWASSQTPMVPRASEAWSRGRIIGQLPVKRPVALQPAPDGGVFLAWPNLDGQLEMARVGVDGEVLLDCVLPVGTAKARDPQLRVGLDNRLHLLWREQGGSRAGINYALLETDGTLVGQPQILSDSASVISGAPLLARGAEGNLHALWADDDGIYWVVLDGEGERVAGPTLLVPEASSPVVQVDDGGRLHLAWQREVQGSTLSICYASLDPERGELDAPEEITSIVVGGLLRLEAVALGLSHDMVYVFWSGHNMRYDRYTFQYASFPLGVPQQRQIKSWDLRIGDGPLAIAPSNGQQTVLPAALVERMMGAGRELELQVTLITMGTGQDGAREQVVTASSQASVGPALIVDECSHLHLAWLETGGFGEYNVVYASTAPEVMENYNALTFLDGLDAALNNVFRLSTVIVSVIVALTMWAIIPLLVLVVYHVVTSEETLDTVRSRVVVIVALALEVALSFMLPPRIGVDITLPALRWVIPAVAAVVTAVVVTAAITANVMRRREYMHLFAAFFLFTGVNSLLQIVMYLLL